MGGNRISTLNYLQIKFYIFNFLLSCIHIKISNTIFLFCLNKKKKNRGKAKVTDHQTCLNPNTG